MNRIDKAFKKLKQENKAAFIPYITAGDPSLAVTEKLVLALEKAGSDIIELGIPFSDPLADGPTIQRAVQRSLKNGCKVENVFKMVERLRRKAKVPLVFMTYYNIVFNYGLERFVARAIKAGADGIIVPDLPMEESEEFSKISAKKDFYVIQLTAPTTPIGRFEKIAAHSKGFVYYVSLTGVTGARKELSKSLAGDVKKMKSVTRKPICVGFGVSTPAQAKDVARVSDGVIVGSAIIKVIEKNLANKNVLVREVEKFAGSLAKAVHTVCHCEP